MKSILQDSKHCWLSGCTGALHSHHIFGGANRKLSEKYGLKVWLLPTLHNLPSEDGKYRGVHHDKELDIVVKKAGQNAFEREHGTREDFMRIFGRNWL